MRQEVTRKDREEVDQLYVTMTAKEIAAHTGRCLGGVKEMLRYSHVRKNRKYTVEELELLDSHLSNAEVAEKIGRTNREISTKRWIMRNAESKREKSEN